MFGRHDRFSLPFHYIYRHIVKRDQMDVDSVSGASNALRQLKKGLRSKLTLVLKCVPVRRSR